MGRLGRAEAAARHAILCQVVFYYQTMAPGREETKIGVRGQESEFSRQSAGVKRYNGDGGRTLVAKKE